MIKRQFMLNYSVNYICLIPIQDPVVTYVIKLQTVQETVKVEGSAIPATF
jgi:hypothetical protein